MHLFQVHHCKTEKAKRSASVPSFQNWFNSFGEQYMIIAWVICVHKIASIIRLAFLTVNKIRKKEEITKTKYVINKKRKVGLNENCVLQFCSGSVICAPKMQLNKQNDSIMSNR